MPRTSRPTAPWQPAKLHVYGVYARSRTARARPTKRGAAPKSEKVFDARYVVDGHEFRFGFAQRGWADDFVRGLHEGFARGWPFDPQARRFMEPRSAEEAALTFFAHAVEFVARKWLSWQPASRRNNQRDLARACLFLLRDDAPALAPAERAAADGYLRRSALMLPKPEHPSPEDESWTAWFERWSRPLVDVGDRDLQDFLNDVRTRTVDGTPRTLSDASLRRTRAVVRSAFTNAARRRLIEWDPWNGVESLATVDHDQVDPDLVMDLAQVFELARACGRRDRRAEPFVLVQGLCGPRPGEAVELRRRDVDLSGAVLTIRGTYSEVPERFFVEGETRHRPMKGRGARARRRVPIPAALAGALSAHMARDVQPEPDALLFTTAAGARLDLSNFHRDVWRQARDEVFPAESPLRRVRRQDLRHSAITAWLNAGVPLKTVQAWSGHKTASVVLDTYLGVMRGDEALGRKRFESALTGKSGST